ncbi:hypothetical protein [Actinotalea solisilvae]|uniref:hypothetical protein n=1 Tax=Actinotalea solisilvae TaxID=2072922 RepID=UPI0018F158B1|nr:hypothetical protein [Actinotalea solisilvae]
MTDHESSHKHGDVSSEPGGADEIAAAPHASREGVGAGSGQGVGVGAGEPSTFEPEEDPSTLPDDPEASGTA